MKNQVLISPRQGRVAVASYLHFAVIFIARWQTLGAKWMTFASSFIGTPHCALMWRQLARGAGKYCSAYLNAWKLTLKAVARPRSFFKAWSLTWSPLIPPAHPAASRFLQRRLLSNCPLPQPKSGWGTEKYQPGTSRVWLSSTPPEPLAQDLARDQQPTLVKVLDIFKFLRNNHQAHAMLQNMSIAQPPLPVPTRWSTVRDSFSFNRHWGNLNEICTRLLKPKDHLRSFLENVALRRQACKGNFT